MGDPRSDGAPAKDLSQCCDARPPGSRQPHLLARAPPILFCDLSWHGLGARQAARHNSEHTVGLVLKRTVSALTGTTYVYTTAFQTADNGGIAYVGNYTMRLKAKRTVGGLTSLLTIERVFSLT